MTRCIAARNADVFCVNETEMSNQRLVTRAHVIPLPPGSYAWRPQEEACMLLHEEDTSLASGCTTTPLSSQARAQSAGTMRRPRTRTPVLHNHCEPRASIPHELEVDVAANQS